MSITWFVSPHGLGHATRSAAIIDELPPNVPVSVHCRVPDWFWDERWAGRCVRAEPVPDFTCVQPSTWDIDIPATLANAEALISTVETIAVSVADNLTATGCRLVVSDISPIPLLAARMARIPSVLVANFTWCSIFRPWNGSERIVSALRALYANADCVWIPGPSVAMPELPDVHHCAWVAARGDDRRCALFPDLSRNVKVALVLPGAWSTPFAWENLAAVSGWRFAGLTRGEPLPDPLIAVDAGMVSHADVVASVDAVVAKPGYGTFGECAAVGTPILTASRPDFSESLVLEQWMTGSGFGVMLPREAFLECRWQAGLDTIAQRTRPDSIRCDGASTMAAAVVQMWQDSQAGSAK